MKEVLSGETERDLQQETIMSKIKLKHTRERVTNARERENTGPDRNNVALNSKISVITNETTKRRVNIWRG